MSVSVAGVVNRVRANEWVRTRKRELRWLMVGVLLVMGWRILAPIVGQYYSLERNRTESLSYHVVLVDKTAAASKGELVAFKMGANKRFPVGTVAVKILAGTAGDVVTVSDREVFINGQHIGRAKEMSKKGEPLEVGPSGVIPPSHYFVYTPHPDSYDSRYADIGWITQEQVVGRAYPIF